MKSLFSLFVLISFSLLISCNSPSSEEDTEDGAEDINDEKFQSSRAEEDAEFIVEAYSFNLMLIEYAKVLQQKDTVPPRLLQYAENAVRFHSEINNTLKELAQAHQVTLPNQVGENVIEYKEELMEKEGEDLYNDYIEVVDDIQEKMILSYNAAAEGSMDNDIRRFANTILSSIRDRHNEINELDEYVEEIK
ncbi:MAG: DUF4142 domain-containing protein [Candidatus Cyclobacteriaceae bacterium M2_1C_046]